MEGHLTLEHFGYTVPVLDPTSVSIDINPVGHTNARVVTFEHSDRDSVRVTFRSVDELERYLESRMRRNLFEGVNERLELEKVAESQSLSEKDVHGWLLLD